MKNTIISKLAEIESREGFEILYACESGSRAWGIASMDSDYDVRFVYLRKEEQYLHLKALRDVCEAELNELYDINGWDLKKFLALLLKSNPAIFEWANSPIIYKTSAKWGKIAEILPDFLDSKKLLFHYYGMAKSHFMKYLLGDEVIYKKYFYVLRPLLACRWLLAKSRAVPMDFGELCAAFLPTYMWDVADELLAIKQNSAESQSGVRIKKLDDFLVSEFEQIKLEIKKHPKGKKPDESVLNELFVEFVGAREF